MVFSTSESDAFLSALVSKQDELWIYTGRIGLALDFLQMPFEEVLLLLHLNHKPFQKKDGSRATWFAEERESLLPLPIVPFELAEWSIAR